MVCVSALGKTLSFAFEMSRLCSRVALDSSLKGSFLSLWKDEEEVSMSLNSLHPRA